jgi:hypothetical protein
MCVSHHDIGELKGKIMGQRVLDSEGPSIETTISFEGTYKGTPAKMTVTFVGRTTSTGVIHGEGQGVVMAGESEVATFTAEAFGRINPTGARRFRGAHFYRTSSNGKLASLNNVVGVFETEVDPEGNAKNRIWEWK